MTIMQWRMEVYHETSRKERTDMCAHRLSLETLMNLLWRSYSLEKGIQGVTLSIGTINPIHWSPNVKILRMISRISGLQLARSHQGMGLYLWPPRLRIHIIQVQHQRQLKVPVDLLHRMYPMENCHMILPIRTVNLNPVFYTGEARTIAIQMDTTSPRPK